MKKFIVLISFFLSLFIVNKVEAKNVNVENFTKKASYKTSTGYVKYKDKLLTEDEGKLISVDLKTADKKEKDYRNSTLIFTDKYVVVIQKENNKTKLSFVNENLEEEKSKNIDIDEIDYISNISDEEYYISGNRLVNGKYYRYLYLLDIDGNIVSEAHILTDSKTEPTTYKNERIRKKIFVDVYQNMYEVRFDIPITIRPLNINSDNTYIIADGCTIKSLDYDGNIKKSINIPDCDMARVKTDASQNHSIIVAAKISTRENDSNSDVTLTVYKVDSDLNIISSEPLSNYTAFGYIIPKKNDSFNMWPYVIESLTSTTLNVVIFKPNGQKDKITYNLVSNNISSSTISRDSWQELFVSYPMDPVFFYNNEDFSGYDEAVNSRIETTYNELINQGTDFDHFNFGSYEKDGENTLVPIIEEKGDSRRQVVVYYDKNFNEIFRYYPHGKSFDESSVFTCVKVYEDYILVASKSTNNKLLILDKKGNVIKDLSSDVSSTTFAPRDVILAEKGLWIRYIAILESKGVSLYSNPLIDALNQVYGTSPVVNRSPDGEMILYYTFFYDIHKKVTGKGSISTDFENAEEGAKIKYTITPDEGYEFVKVEVTDENGNVLTSLENTFTMPAASVTIEAVFAKIAEPEPQNQAEQEDNPNTGSKSLLIAFIAFVLSLAIVFTYQHQTTKIK